MSRKNERRHVPPELRIRPTMLWHYTPRFNVQKIIESGEIRPTDVGIDKGERPVVWFSSNPHWEETVNVAMGMADGSRVLLTREQMHFRCGLARFAVLPDVAPYRWGDFIRLSGVSEQTANGMKRSGERRGSSHYQWFLSFDSVPTSVCQAIEQWDGRRWAPYVAGTHQSDRGLQVA